MKEVKEMVYLGVVRFEENNEERKYEVYVCAKNSQEALELLAAWARKVVGKVSKDVWLEVYNEDMGLEELEELEHVVPLPYTAVYHPRLGTIIGK